MKYSMNEPVLVEEEKRYINEVLDSGWIGINGFHTKEFEKKFAQKTGVNYAIAVQSGSAALHTALSALELNKNSAIVIPNFTCGACLTSSVLAGLRPIILDIETDTFGLDAQCLRKLIQEHRTPDAVMLVHMFGFPARDTIEISEICADHDIALVEDCAEAHMAKLNRKCVGTFGDIATYSIRSDKIIGIGEGGVVTSSNADLMEKSYYYASRAAPFRTHESDYWRWFEYTGFGMNYLLPHILGAIAHAQINHIEEFIAKRQLIGNYYRELVNGIKDIKVQKIITDSEPVYWLNALLIDRSIDQIRAVGTRMISDGIEIRPGFIPLSQLQAFSKYAHGKQDNGVDIYNKMLIIPSSVKLNSTDQDFIISTLKQYLHIGV